MNRKLFVRFGIIVFILVSLLISAGIGEAANKTPFKPSWGPAGTSAVTYSTTALSGNPDITTKLNIDAIQNGGSRTAGGTCNISNPCSANFAENVTYTDNAMILNTPSAIPIGAYVGQLSSIAWLGLLNGPCNSQFPVVFNFVNATVNAAASNQIGDSGPASNVLANWAEDDGDLNNDHQASITAPVAVNDTTIHVLDASPFAAGVAVGATLHMGGASARDTVTFASANTVLNTITLQAPGATATHIANDTIAEPDTIANGDPVNADAYAYNGIPDAGDAYPTGLLTAFNNLVPVARYMGVAFVANTLIVPLNLLVFPAGGLISLPSHAWMSSAWGSPSEAVLNDPGAVPSNSSITDYCNFSSTTLLDGVSHDNGCTPSAAANAALCVGQGAGFQLRLACDATPPVAGCAGTTPNESGTVRTTNPSTTTCPTGSCTVRVRDFSQSARDAINPAFPTGKGYTNDLNPCASATTADTVWDPWSQSPPGDTDADGIPNSCDVTPTSCADFTCNDEDNGGVGDGWQNRGDDCPLVINGTFTTTPNDQQFDSDIGPTGAVYDNGPRIDSIGAVCDPHPLAPDGRYSATMITQNVCIGGVTLDCSTLLADDYDADGIANAFDNCLHGANAQPAGFAQSQRDVTGDHLSDISDLSAVTGKFGKIGGDPTNPPGYEGRLDLNFDSQIDIVDVSLMAGTFGKSC